MSNKSLIVSPKTIRLSGCKFPLYYCCITTIAHFPCWIFCMKNDLKNREKMIYGNSLMFKKHPLNFIQRSINNRFYITKPINPRILAVLSNYPSLNKKTPTSCRGFSYCFRALLLPSGPCAITYNFCFMLWNFLFLISSS